MDVNIYVSWNVVDFFYLEGKIITLPFLFRFQVFEQS